MPCAKKLSPKKSPSSYVLGANARRHVLGDVGSPHQSPHVSRGFHHEAGLLNQHWTATATLCALRLYSLDVLVVIRAQHLAQIGVRGPLPRNAENFARTGNVFT